MLNRELEALIYAKKAVELEPDNGDYWCFLAGLQAKYDLPDDAVVSFENAIDEGYLLEDVWEDFAQLELNRIKKLRIQLEANRVKAFERWVIRKSKFTFASPNDAVYLSDN